MTEAGIVGVVGLDEPVPFYDDKMTDKAVGYSTLREVMYAHVKLEDVHSLFAEIHQETVMSTLEVVILNTPEAEHLA